MRDFDLQKLQQIEYEMLSDVGEFCANNNIRYFLDDGTLLGAIRHDGFIPWDDDIDIAMDLENYKKFVKCAPNGLKPKYFIQTFYTDPKCAICWCKVRKNGTTSMEANMTDYDIHYGICIDIFVYIGIADSKIGKKIQKRLISSMNVLLYKYLNAVTKYPVGRKVKLVYKILPDHLRIGLIKLLQNLAYLDTLKHKLCYSPWYDYPRKFENTFSSSIFCKDNESKHIFEGKEFPIMKNYEEVLEKKYGDWRKLPPIEERQGHGDIIVDFDHDYKLYYTGK